MIENIDNDSLYQTLFVITKISVVITAIGLFGNLIRALLLLHQEDAKKQENNMDIEYLIATHPDSDHIGGMQQVFKDLKVKNFIYPKDAPHTTQTWNNVLSLANSEGCTIKDATPNTTMSSFENWGFPCACLMTGVVTLMLL